MSLQGITTTERKVWRCDDCGHHGTWGEDWKWLGILEDRKTGLPDVERVLCPDCPMDPDIPVLPG